MTTVVFGRLGRDAELRRTANGDPVCNLALAVNYGRKDQSGQRPTQWYECALWGKRAEALAGYLTKGAGVVVTLEELHTETFDKRDGGQSVKLVGQVSNIEFTGGQQERAPAPRAPVAKPAPRQQSTGFEDIPDDLDSDVPF